MGTAAGTTTTYSVGSGGGNREDLEDVIHELFPDETWAQTNLDKVRCSATLHEWLGDELAAPGSNIAIEGEDATFATLTNPARYANYTQIFKKTFLVSGTQEVVNKAGRRSEIARQAVKKMRELKNDVEYALVRNQTGTAGGANTGRALASLESWIGATSPSASVATNVVRSTSSAATGNYPETASGVPIAQTDQSTTAALEEAKLRLALEAAWAKGAMTDTILVSANVKDDINAFTGIAERNVNLNQRQQAVITGAADIYVSNFGVHRVVLHRHVRSSVAICVDSSLLAIGTLRNYQMERLAKTGDGEKRQLLAEKTLVVRNWKGLSKVVGIA
jgi:hypothetical protein